MNLAGVARGREDRMGRIPFKGWLLLMLGASRAPLSAEEARAMRRSKARDEPAGTTVVVPPPMKTKHDAADALEHPAGPEPR